MADSPRRPPQLSCATSWVLAQLGKKPGRSRSIMIVAGMVTFIGWLDYITGIRVSLALLYVVPIMLSVAWLGWPAGCLTALACILVRVAGDLAIAPYQYPRTVFWNRLMDFSVYVVLVWVLHGLISLWRQLEDHVRHRTAALEQAIRARDQLQTQLFEISRRERSAIGHDLHDGLGQQLTATAMAADLLAKRLSEAGQPAADDARAIVRMLQSGIAQTRQIARGLLLAAIEPEELVSELEELCATLGREYQTECRFVWRGTTAGLDAAVSSHLFYIAQEAARNALRHARPTLLEISLASEPDALELIVSDNGCGISAAKKSSSGMGLRVMEHRAQIIGGNFFIEPGSAGGTRVRCRVPLPRRESGNLPP